MAVDPKSAAKISQNPPEIPSRRYLSESSGMTETRPSGRKIARLVRKKWLWAVVSAPLILWGILGLLTEPLEVRIPAPGVTPKIKANPAPTVARLADWPTTSMDGHPAMILLLDSLLDARTRLESAGAYTAILHKTERLNGKLGAEQILEMKCRNEPFAVYFKYRTPEAGKEVVYSTGRYDNNVIAHGGGFSRALIPRLKIAPTSDLAMRGNRHPITDAGLKNLINRLIGYREMDLKDTGSLTVLDRVKDSDGREWLRSLHTHTLYKSDRPFMIVEVWYDPATRIPVKILSYDWQPADDKSEPKLAEKYHYVDLKLGAELSDSDFDPANPSYAFSRF